MNFPKLSAEKSKEISFNGKKIVESAEISKTFDIAWQAAENVIKSLHINMKGNDGEEPIPQSAESRRLV